MTSRPALTPLFALTAFALCGTLALAQAAPAPAPPDSAPPSSAPIERPPNPGPGMHPGMMHGGFSGPQHSAMEAGFHIVPPGMWWRNPMVVQRLALTPDQVKRMDGIFQQSRLQLIDLKANVEKQNAMLEPLLSANPPDTALAMAQIDKVAQARADLEKADAKMLLGIREVLTPDQWTKLDEGRGPGGFGGPGGRNEMGGFGAGGGQ